VVLRFSRRTFFFLGFYPPSPYHHCRRILESIRPTIAAFSRSPSSGYKCAGGERGGRAPVGAVLLVSHATVGSTLQLPAHSNGKSAPHPTSSVSDVASPSPCLNSCAPPVQSDSAANRQLRHLPAPMSMCAFRPPHLSCTT
jgi:hypothetical protein